MQRNITNEIQLGDTLNPLADYGGASSVDDESNLESIFGKIDKIGDFWRSGKTDENLARFIPNILPVTRQNQIASTTPREAFT